MSGGMEKNVDFAIISIEFFYIFGIMYVGAFGTVEF